MGILILYVLVVGTIIIINDRERERKRRTREQESEYKQIKYASYKEASGTDLSYMEHDKGTYGEFLIFEQLEKLEGNYKILTNLYLPKADGTTTEVDLVLVSQTGIYVFESKNYGGRIFGNENHKNWTQVFKNQQKHRFFNPIWQNNGHIKGLKLALGIEDDKLYKSYIVFSERCELKDITLKSSKVKVIKRNDLLHVIRRDIETSRKIVAPQHVEVLYLELEQYTRVDVGVKEAHIANLQG